MAKKWICTVCGYVHEGETAPERCPQCGVPADKFKLLNEEGIQFACEHELGSAKGVSKVCTTTSWANAPKWVCISL